MRAPAPGRFRRAAPLLALCFGACFGRGGERDVDGAVLQRVAQCGGGLSFSRGFRLAIASDLGDNSLSAERRRDIRAAIFAKVPARDRAAVFDTYTACITSERQRGELLDEILARRDEFSTQLAGEALFSPEQIGELLAYYDREHAAARDGDFVKARKVRGELVMRYAMLSFDAGTGDAPVPPLVFVPPPAPPAYEPPPQPTYKAPSEGAAEQAPVPSPLPVALPPAPPTYAPAPLPAPASPAQAFLERCADVEDRLLCEDAVRAVARRSSR